MPPTKALSPDARLLVGPCSGRGWRSVTVGHSQTALRCGKAARGRAGSSICGVLLAAKVSGRQTSFVHQVA